MRHYEILIVHALNSNSNIIDLRHYSSFTDVLRGNINLENELFGLSENSPMLVQNSPPNDEVATSKKKTTRGIGFSLEEDKLLVAA